jgi:hypothetical protein
MPRRLCYILGALCVAMGCAPSAKKPLTIPSPEWAYRSPNLDFSKIRTLCVFPPMAAGAETPDVTSGLGLGVQRHISAENPTWRVVSNVDLLQVINTRGLGRGYQNCVSDLSTHLQVAMATPAFTAETKGFLSDLSRHAGCDAVLFLRYSFASDFLGSTLGVRTILYYIPESRAWWAASFNFTGPREWQQTVELVAQGIARSLGQGAIRQL